MSVFPEFIYVSDFLEHIFTSSADGADPVVGDILKSRSRSNAALGIANLRIVYVMTFLTFVSVHVKPPVTMIIEVKNSVYQYR